MLSVTNLSAAYGAIPALQSFTLSVRAGELVALVGANGAGKTTALRTIAGLHPASEGRVTLGDVDLTDFAGHQVVKSGLALVPEGRMVVSPLTVQENLDLSAYGRKSRPIEGVLEQVFEMFPRLAERRSQHAGLLSGGEQQMLALGRALMTAPQVILLDEPSMGLSPAMVDVVFDAIETVRANGIAVLLVEQNAALALEMASEVHVLERGRIVLSGAPDEVRGSRAMEEAYLG